MRIFGKIVGLIAALVALLVVSMAVLDRVIPEPMARTLIDLQRSVSGLQLKQAQIPGFDIPYLEGGPAGGEALVLVHGIGADKDNFDRVAMHLTPQMRVISIDLPGFGDASKPADADYSIDKQVERLDQFLATLKIDRVHLGGSSMGGWIMASYAAAHPKKVSSLWLLDAAGVATAKPSGVLTAYTERGEYLLFAKTPQDFDRILLTVMSKPPYLPGSVKQVVTERAITNYDLHTRIFRDMVASQKPVFLESRVAGLLTPTLITWGEEDRATDVSGAKILHQLIPRSQLQILPGIGHLPHLEASSETAQAYLDFRKNLAR
ncbi:MAG TPA: alpha/beta fold hydrolase [Polaromonas sp.]|uniref:alpha/beta fold hydrolase n=1 Tax=Polaromonas sp. TaxID=1869339 RepID=UPI002D390681|nr:alpha/beta fold hydrolase [Polaromonas sp.]HYW57375.1 alpha/beta fold hydrolase [Polaromonas sp.]